MGNAPCEITLECVVIPERQRLGNHARSTNRIYRNGSRISIRPSQVQVLELGDKSDKQVALRCLLLRNRGQELRDGLSRSHSGSDVMCHSNERAMRITVPLGASVDVTDARNAAAVRKPGTSIVRIA